MDLRDYILTNRITAEFCFAQGTVGDGRGQCQGADTSPAGRSRHCVWDTRETGRPHRHRQTRPLWGNCVTGIELALNWHVVIM